METITPLSITGAVKSFCESISNQTPIYLDFEYEFDSVKLFCTENVQRKIQRDGGNVKYGWQIAICEPFLIEAQFHAVWVDLNNIIHDITPRQDENMKKILFLPDSNIKYENKQINNIRKSLVEDKLVYDFINICDRYFEATNRGDLASRVGVISLDELSKEHFTEIRVLQIEKARLFMAIHSKYS